MGYDLDRLLEQLDAQPFRTHALLGDAVRLANAVAREPVRARNRRNGVGGPSVIRALL
jgi:hypothetical protein